MKGTPESRALLAAVSCDPEGSCAELHACARRLVEDALDRFDTIQGAAGSLNVGKRTMYKIRLALVDLRRAEFRKSLKPMRPLREDS